MGETSHSRTKKFFLKFREKGHVALFGPYCVFLLCGALRKGLKRARLGNNTATNDIIAKIFKKEGGSPARVSSLTPIFGF
jgi:hypothetical protein